MRIVDISCVVVERVGVMCCMRRVGVIECECVRWTRRRRVWVRWCMEVTAVPVLACATERESGQCSSTRGSNQQASPHLAPPPPRNWFGRGPFL